MKYYFVPLCHHFFFCKTIHFINLSRFPVSKVFLDTIKRIYTQASLEILRDKFSTPPLTHWDTGTHLHYGTVLHPVLLLPKGDHCNA